MKKVSKSRIASTYALALYEGALERNAVNRVFTDTEKLLQALETDKETVKYLANPMWSLESKKEALKEVAEKMDFCAETLNCLDIVTDNNRCADLVAILGDFKHLYYTKNNIVEVEIQTAIELTEVQNKKVRANLEAFLAKEVIINYVIKPEILGGLVIKYGSSMIDDSIIGKLNRLELVMKG